MGEGEGVDCSRGGGEARTSFGRARMTVGGWIAGGEARREGSIMEGGGVADEGNK